MREQVRQQQVPIIGHGQGVWNWIHIDDPADATVRTLDCAPGAYNIVDDNPSEQRGWLTAFARYRGALAPPHLSERQALESSGPDAVYYATQLRGASNAKAKRELGFRPRPLQWLVYTNGTKLLPRNRARLGETHFETWLTQFAGSARAASTRTDKR